RARGDTRKSPFVIYLFRRTELMTHTLIRVDDLRVGYGGRVVLDHVSMEIHKNEVLCLVGHNGAGKSTLLNSLFGVVARQGGEMSVDGQRGHHVEPKKMASLG